MTMAISDELLGLISLAALTGCLHTLAGPDHYLPFIVMSRSRGWSRWRTAAITFVCGLGHVLGSVALGGIGIAAGYAITRMEEVESVRGDIAAWFMIAFGLAYAAWGMKKMWRKRPHRHAHIHEGGLVHSHTHFHEKDHVHVHEDPKGASRSLTPWVLFTIFIFGPCEVLIPLLMVPAAKESLFGLVLVTLVFAAATIGTMLALVLALSYGFQAVRLGWLERNMHSVAGLTVALCGFLILIGL
jgi:sulfite exporter TauE/SafE